MKFASRVVVGSLVALSFTVAFAAEAPVEVRHVIARAEVGVAAPEPIAASELDAYVGRYDADGVAFVVDREGAALTIEALPHVSRGPVRLYAADVRNSFTAEDWVRVVFERDANGYVVGLLLYASSNEAIAASKAPLRRGIVTIHDLSEDGASSPSPLAGLVRSF